jgi:hypothetical protein
MRFISLLLPLSLLASVILAVPTEKTADLVERNVDGSVDVLSVVTTLKSSVVSPDSLATLPHFNRYLYLFVYLYMFLYLYPLPLCRLVSAAQTLPIMRPLSPAARR